MEAKVTIYSYSGAVEITLCPTTKEDERDLVKFVTDIRQVGNFLINSPSGDVLEVDKAVVA